MCGRYTISVTMEELMLRFYLDEFAPFYEPRYNAAPGQMVPVIMKDGQQNTIEQLRWGLIPFWAKDTKIGYKMINARVETVAEKPAYRTSFKSKRCIIPADGFYEWNLTEDGKQPMRILLKTGELFGMAGLYDTWESPEGEKISSCTIITTEPNKLMADIHDRMPVILKREDETNWLDKGAKVEQLKLLLKPYDAEEMRAYPVGQGVANVKNHGPECIAEIYLKRSPS